jgi:hypothetical protein
MEVQITDSNGTRTETIPVADFIKTFMEVKVELSDDDAHFQAKKRQRKMTSLIHDAINSGVDPVELCMNGGLVVDTENDTWYA